MGKVTGFREFPRVEPGHLPPEERVKHSKEFLVQLPTPKLREQGARCMDCGVPFCHSACPLGNLIPDWNDLVYRDDWKRAAKMLHATNNFPELTGRICPAPCEEACVLSIHQPAVTIKNIEGAIVERAFEEGWIEPRPPRERTEKRVAVVGSGPSGLACADQLNRAGHSVTVFERADKIGGLLRYGIPDFKLSRTVLDRRLAVLEQEGIVFRTGVHVGHDITADELKRSFDAVVLAVGSTRARDLELPGRNLRGVHLAMEFLSQQNAVVAENDAWKDRSRWWFSGSRDRIVATGKDVVVIGGGDSGADCVGTCHRQGAKSVTQFELRDLDSYGDGSGSWPYWPIRVRSCSSHEEGGAREWGISTVKFTGQLGRVTGLQTARVKFGSDGSMQVLPHSEHDWPAQLVLIAAGFAGPETNALEQQLGIVATARGTIGSDDQYQTNVPGIFTCGDARRGQSLVVWAISEGREAARAVDLALRGATQLPTKGAGDLLAA
ncbi:MAG: glutamate synthase subunit beta [Bdellovibrionota bacterium]